MYRSQYIGIAVSVVFVTLITLHFTHGLSLSYAILLGGVHAMALGFASYFIRLNYFIKSYHHGDRTEKKIALTFDDGPVGLTSEVLDILKEQEVPAAFFCIGYKVEGLPKMVKRMYEEGHIIGNHSHRHSHGFDMMSAKKVKNEIDECSRAIIATIGKAPKLFRPPYGVTNPNVAKGIRRANMLSIGWSLRSYDTTAKDGQKLKNKILKKLKGGDVILLHDRVPVTVEILTELIEEAREKGFTFVGLDELLDIQPYA